MRPLKENISITLDRDMIETIKILAKHDSRTFSQYINMVLRGHIKAKSDKIATIKEEQE